MILIVDDEKENRESLSALLKRDQWECDTAANGNEALEKLRENRKIQLLITDLKMPGGLDGIELMELTREIRPEVQRLLVTAFGTVESTVQAMKMGAFDVLTKPLKGKELREKVKEIVQRTVSSENSSSNDISESYNQTLQDIRKAALSEATVLFRGESGIGKSFLAKTLHNLSRRAEKPFHVLNTRAFSPEQIENELFGVTTTGSALNRGLLLAAHGGTLLIEDIEMLPPSLQSRLLQYLSDGQFYQSGAQNPISCKTRILASSASDLDYLAEQGKIRRDLYQALQIVSIDIAPIRERREDLYWLVPSLLDKLCEKHGRGKLRLSNKCFSKLWNHSWPANIRELEGVLEKLIVLAAEEELSSGLLGEKHLPKEIFQNKEQDNSQIVDLATLEKKAIRHALTVTGGNRRLTAKLLGISERTLYRALENQDLESK